MMVEAVDRYCPNPDCPALRGKQGARSRRWLCAVTEDAYVEVICPACKQRWTWYKGELVARGSLIFEDITVARPT